jgi:hypothetical protein
MDLGNYYKIQIAFISKDDNSTPYYSTAGTFKLIDMPKFFLSESGGVWTGSYIAEYSTLESSQFILRKAYTNEIIEESSLIYHDKSKNGFESYKFNTTLDFSNNYQVEWIAFNDEGS